MKKPNILMILKGFFVLWAVLFWFLSFYIGTYRFINGEYVNIFVRADIGYNVTLLLSSIIAFFTWVWLFYQVGKIITDEFNKNDKRLEKSRATKDMLIRIVLIALELSIPILFIGLVFVLLCGDLK